MARALLNWDASKLSLVYLMGRLMTVYIGDGLCWFMTRQSVGFELDILKLGHTLYDMLPSQPNPSRAQLPG